MMRFKILLILCWVILLGCESKKNAKQSQQDEFIAEPASDFKDKGYAYRLIDSALLYGDTLAYKKVSSYYLIKSKHLDFFYYAFTMANKYNYPEAHYHVYLIIAFSTPKIPKEAFQEMNSRSKNMAIYYLLKSYEMGYKDAKYDIEALFRKNKQIPKLSEYLDKFCRE